MTETREFPTEVVASISTGRLLCKFSDMKEAAEYLMGHPIWTHQFGSDELCEKMRTAVLAQCPGIPGDIEGCNAKNYRKHISAIKAKIGATCRISKGSGQ